MQGLLPQIGTQVEVSFLNEDDVEVWWEATVVRMGKKKPKGSVACHATLVYEAAHGREDEETEVKFMRNGDLRHKDMDESGETSSKWRFKESEFNPAGRITDEIPLKGAPVDETGRGKCKSEEVGSEPLARTSPRVRRNSRRSSTPMAYPLPTSPPDRGTSTRTLHRAELNFHISPGDGINSLGKSTPTDAPPLRTSYAEPGNSRRNSSRTLPAFLSPPRTAMLSRRTSHHDKRNADNPSIEDASYDELTIQKIMQHVEANLGTQGRGFPQKLEREVGKELRVSAKRGICTAILRPPRRLVARDDENIYDGVLQTGVIVWTCKVSMERFQIFAGTIESFYKNTRRLQGRAVVRFDPGYDVIKGDVGFGEARASFSSAVDMLRFLGVTRSADLKTLLWNPCGENGDHVRVLGGTQIGGCEAHPKLRLFLGYSCTTKVQEEDDKNDGGSSNETKATCFSYTDAAWDIENNCFAHEPELKRYDTAYNTSELDDCLCFQITWEVDRTTSQRQLSHVAMDSEGVRNGKMVVQMPYFLAGPQIQPHFTNLCGDGILDTIIAKLSTEQN